MKSIEHWKFHEDYYNEETRILPQSVQQMVVSRLTNCKRPVDDVKAKSERIEKAINKMVIAYTNKKQRAKAEQRARRAAEDEDEDEDENKDDKQPDIKFDHSNNIKELLGTLKKDPHQEFREIMRDYKTLRLPPSDLN
jgi:hypothetical protein